MYHVEGAGGGHAPDLLKVVSYDNVIPSSTNPTNPFTSYALDEGVPMTMIAHQLNYNTPEDVLFGEARVRAQSMAAEDFLHDMGAISIFGTDTQGMGRLAENVTNCWQLASVMKKRIGRLPGGDHRPRRQRADQALHRQAHHQPGDRRRHRRPCRLHRGRQDGRPRALAAGLLRRQAGHGDQERLHRLGDDGRRQWSLGVAEPLIQKRMWGALGAAPQQLGVNFVSRLAEQADVGRKLGLGKTMVPITNVRHLRKTHMVRNAAMPFVEVDPQTFEVRADGKLLMCEPARKVPLARRYMLR